MEGSGSVGRGFDWGLKGCYFKTHQNPEQDTFICCLVLVQPRKLCKKICFEFLTRSVIHSANKELGNACLQILVYSVYAEI